MKLYLIENTGDVDYGEFCGFVVAFNKASDAKRFEHDHFPKDKGRKIMCIGNAAGYIEDGQILLSDFKSE